MRHVHAARLRVVWDTNVYVSALQFEGEAGAKAWRAALDQRYRLIISPPILNDLGRVLRDDFGWKDPRLSGRLRMISKLAQIVVPRRQIAVVRDDPDDDRILEGAVAGKADLIVSGDKHLRRLKIFEGIPIVTVMDLLRMLD